MIDAIDAIYQRFASDATLEGLVGVDVNGDIRAYPEWPDEKTDWDNEVARIAITLPITVQNRGTDETTVQVDIFTRKNASGLTNMAAIDDRIMFLLHEKWWNDVTSAKRIYCVQIGGAVRPTADADPWHWMREFAVRAS